MFITLITILSIMFHLAFLIEFFCVGWWAMVLAEMSIIVILSILYKKG